MKKNIKKAQSLIEYGLILALVAVVAIAALQLLGKHINNAAKTSGQNIEDAAENAGKAYCDSIGGDWKDNVCVPTQQ